MVIASPCTKSNVFNAYDATVPAPFLLSPISIAHRNQMLDTKTGRHSTGNAIRDQWVANLQNKRMAAAAAGTNDPMGNEKRLASGTMSSSASNSNCRINSAKKNSCSRNTASRAASKSRNAALLSVAALKTRLNTRQRNSHRHSQIAMSDADVIALERSSMLFNGIGSFELESPSFSPLSSSSLDGDFPLSPLFTPKKAKGWSERGTKIGSKKSTIHCLAYHTDQPNPRTPRRKLNCGSATSDIFDLDYFNGDSNASGFSDDETPSNISVDASCANTRCFWDQDLDFSGAEGYADTFFDSPAPQLAVMPLMPTSQRSNISSTNNSSEQSNDEQDAPSKFDHPESIHLSSIEPEEFSDFLEQTDLDCTDGDRGGELYQLVASPLVDASKSPFSRGSYFTLRPGVTAEATVDECYRGKSATSSSSWPMSSPSPTGSSSEPNAAATRCCMAPRDQKHPSEFETLMDDYNCTDIQHELDSVYLDTMDVIGNDLG